MRIIRNFDPKILNLSNLMPNVSGQINKSLIEAGVIIKTAFIQELKATDKRGSENPRNRYGGRRSARGQSLANDSGNTLSLINSYKTGNNITAGILNNRIGENYVAVQEGKGRSTLTPVIKKVSSKIDNIFQQNLQPK